VFVYAILFISAEYLMDFFLLVGDGIPLFTRPVASTGKDLHSPDPSSESMGRSDDFSTYNHKQAL
jgi:hypothetical protein